jgi:hypothetical protein
MQKNPVRIRMRRILLNKRGQLSSQVGLGMEEGMGMVEGMEIRSTCLSMARRRGELNKKREEHVNGVRGDLWHGKE